MKEINKELFSMKICLKEDINELIKKKDLNFENKESILFFNPTFSYLP